MIGSAAVRGGEVEDAPPGIRTSLAPLVAILSSSPGCRCRHPILHAVVIQVTTQAATRRYRYQQDPPFQR
jgi:hypothetical protein